MTCDEQTLKKMKHRTLKSVDGDYTTTGTEHGNNQRTHEPFLHFDPAN